MVFPENYFIDLSDVRRQKYFPNLKLDENFIFTSLKTDEYNCVAWSLQVSNEWIEYNLDVNDYINHFSTLGFVRSETREYTDGIERIAIYADNKNQFTHIARQLSNGQWTSKIGEWEDIQHNTLEDVSGEFYGYPFIIMEK